MRLEWPLPGGHGPVVPAVTIAYRHPAGNRDWIHQAIAALECEAVRSADTHLRRLVLPGYPGIDFYLKDESAHPTGSLKHRLARSLFLYALCNGRLRQGQTVVDASSGSTAISEAWFARLLGLRFVAVMPAGTAPGKLREVRALGGHCALVPDGADCRAHAMELVAGDDACFLDQFGLAERATDWRGNNNIAESIFGQLRHEPHRQPAWIVCGAGTGGTSATIGRYLRYRRFDTRLCVADPSGAAFAAGWRDNDPDACATRPTLVEGIGRSRVEPGFLFDVVDAVIEVPDAASCAGASALAELLGHRYGASSGCNWVACLHLAQMMRARGQVGGIVSLLCDRGERYAETVFDPDWRRARGLDHDAWLRRLRAGMTAGAPLPPGDDPNA